MQGLRTNFFADAQDMLHLLEAFRELGDFRYTAISGAVNAQLAEFCDPLELLNCGVVSSGAPTRGAGYMITDMSTPITTRKIKMSDGSGFKMTLDQSSNPDCIHIALGGDAGDRTLISSIIDTHGDTDRARAIHALFRKQIAKLSKRVSGTLVMPGAMEKLADGWRLTAGKGFHRGLDLKK